MRFTGYCKTFSTRHEAQYEAIGAFWDEMASLYGLENLQGLGFGWTADTIDYAIGFKDDRTLPLPAPDGCTLIAIELPTDNWATFNGLTDQLSILYDEIYQTGPLDYEIEQFNTDGTCLIQVCRLPRG